MDLFLENLKQIFKIDSNTAATIVITIFVFVAGIIINLIVKWIGEFLRRNRTKKLLRIIIEELYFTYPWYGEGARGNGSFIPVYQYTSGGKKAEIFPFSLYAYSGGTVEIGF